MLGAKSDPSVDVAFPFGEEVENFEQSRVTGVRLASMRQWRIPGRAR